MPVHGIRPMSNRQSMCAIQKVSEHERTSERDMGVTRSTYNRWSCLSGSRRLNVLAGTRHRRWREHTGRLQGNGWILRECVNHHT